MNFIVTLFKTPSVYCGLGCEATEQYIGSTKGISRTDHIYLDINLNI